MTDSYYITFSEHAYEVSPPSNERGEWTWRGETGVDVSLNSIARSQSEDYHYLVDAREAFYGFAQIPSNHRAYVVLVSYRDGDTFGVHEEWTIPAVCLSRADAEHAVARCEAAIDPDLGITWRPWDGFFASLNSVEIVEMVMKP